MQTKEDPKKSGDNRLNVRINPVWREAFGISAKARWTDATGLIHQFVKAVVDIDRKKHPVVFRRFGDLDSIPLADTKDEVVVVPNESPEDIRRIAYLTEITTMARDLLAQSGGGITVDQAAAAIIESLTATGDTLYKSGKVDVVTGRQWEHEDTDVDPDIIPKK